MGLPADTFAGALDDVMVFDYALDEEAVIELYRRRHH
jgi:hypothetical protein